MQLVEMSNLILKEGKKAKSKGDMTNVLANAFTFTQKANKALKGLK